MPWLLFLWSEPLTHNLFGVYARDQGWQPGCPSWRPRPKRSFGPGAHPHPPAPDAPQAQRFSKARCWALSSGAGEPGGRCLFQEGEHRRGAAARPPGASSALRARVPGAQNFTAEMQLAPGASRSTRTIALLPSPASPPGATRPPAFRREVVGRLPGIV